MPRGLGFLVFFVGCASPQRLVTPRAASTPTPGFAVCDAKNVGELVAVPGAREPIEQSDLRLCVVTKSGKYFWIALGTKITDDGVEL